MNIRALTTLLAFVALLSGCASKEMAIDITTVDGCMVQMKGVSMESAKQITNTWTFGDDCSITVKEEES